MLILLHILLLYPLADEGEFSTPPQQIPAIVSCVYLAASNYIAFECGRFHYQSFFKKWMAA
jgi:hypothetical protein